MQDKDKFLVEKFQQGDKTAFDELVRKYQKKMAHVKNKCKVATRNRVSRRRRP